MCELTGFKTLPKWLKTKYLEAVNHKCQSCNSTKNLEIHRIKRGNKNGLYTLVPLNHKSNNIKVLCKECHKKYHYKEQGCGK